MRKLQSFYSFYCGFVLAQLVLMWRCGHWSTYGSLVGVVVAALLLRLAFAAAVEEKHREDRLL